MDPTSSAQHDQFLTLFTNNEAAIRAYVRRLVPTRDDASDIMQGIALVLWRKFSELDHPDHFRRWAFGVARYESLAWLRDRRRDRLVLSEDVIDALAGQNKREETRLTEQRYALEDCLGKLSETQRGQILAAYAPGAQIQKVASTSGRSVTAFYQWLHRMRLRLVECTRRSMHSETI